MTDFFFSHSGNIVLKPGSSSKILERDVFTQADCELSAKVMVESADAYAAIVVWTPEQAGFASGKKEKRKASMSDMWQTALEGFMENDTYKITPQNNDSFAVNRDKDGDEDWVLPQKEQDTEGMDVADIARRKKRKRDQDVQVRKIQKNAQYCSENRFILGEERVHISVHSSMHAIRRHGSWQVVEVLQHERHADSHQLGLLRPDWNWVRNV